MAPLFQTSEERQADTEKELAFVVKAYFSDSTEVYRGISDEAKLSDLQRRALEKQPPFAQPPSPMGLLL